MVVGATAVGGETRLATLEISDRRLKSAPPIGIRSPASRPVGLHVTRNFPRRPGARWHLREWFQVFAADDTAAYGQLDNHFVPRIYEIERSSTKTIRWVLQG